MSKSGRRRRRRNILVNSFKSEEEFSKEYSESDVDSARKLHFKILEDVLQALASNDVYSFKKLCRLIHCIHNLTNTDALQANYNHRDNPVKDNIIILACKVNKSDILKEVFQNETIPKYFANTIGQTVILPDDRDKEHHTAFYYAIRSGNVELIETLVNKWPGSHLSDDLDKLLSSAYEELKLKNVKITVEMVNFIETKLLNLRFWCDNKIKISNCKDLINTDVIERMTFLLKNIKFLQVNYINAKVDEAFLLTAKSIAQNMHTLKRQLKVTYDNLPWEEVEYFLFVFIDCMGQCSEEHFIDHIIVNKDKLLLYLDIFARHLCDENDRIQNTNAKKLLEIPKLTRDVVVAHIKKNTPEFETLYRDYNIIRDVNSLQTMKKYIDVAVAADCKTTEGQFIIIRTLQVIGEHIKNTLQSPRLSPATSKLLIYTLTRNTRMILIELRDTLSHSYSLYGRVQIESSENDFFNGVQSDIRKLNEVIIDTLSKIKINAIRMQLQKIIDSCSLEEILQVQETFTGFDFENMQISSTDNKKSKLSDIEEQVSQLSKLVKDQTYHESELLQKIFQIIKTEKSKSRHLKTCYIHGFITLKHLNHSMNSRKIDSNEIKHFQDIANNTLKFFQPEINLDISKILLDISNKFFTSVEPRLHSKVASEVTHIVYRIFCILECGLGEITCFGEILHKLNKTSFQKNQCSANENIASKGKFDTQLAQRISALSDLLPINVLQKQPIQEISSCLNKSQPAIEMLVLDILSILGENKKALTDNQLFLDETYPLLMGKSLRNHLAHHNVVNNTLYCDYSTVLLANASILCNGKMFTDKKKIGKIVLSNITKLEAKYEQDLLIINNQTDMFNALVEGNLNKVRSSIAEGADINARSWDMWTALHYAAKSSSVECVKYVLDHNIGIDLKNFVGQSALHIATKYGHTKVVKFLVEKRNMNVNDADNSGRNCLHLAIQHGFRDIVLLLLKNKADLRKQDVLHFSPMHCAVLNNQTNIVKILLEKSPVEDEYYGGYSLLNLASESGFLDIVKVLLKNKANVNAINDNLAIPLHTAALNGHFEVVKTLISNGSDVNIRNIYGCSPLHYAVENQHTEVVKILLDNGAEVNFVDKLYNRTPISYAAQDGHMEIFKMLLLQRANVNIASVQGTTTLQYAAMKGAVDIVDLLVRTGALVNDTDNLGFTALHLSSMNGHTNVVKYLIEKRGNINAQNMFNQTPLHLAADKGKTDVAEILLSEGANINLINSDGNTSLYCCCEQGHTDTIHAFIKHGADLEIKNKFAMTAFHAAVYSGVWEAVEALIVAGANVYVCNSMGFSSLHLASIAGHTEVTKGLIRIGINVNIKGNNGVIPLHLAVLDNHLSVVQILIENGSEINPVSCMELSTDLASIPNIRETLRNEMDRLVDANFSCDPVSSLLEKLEGDKEVPTYTPNSVNENYTPLYFAVCNNNKEIVSFLMSKGADVNAADCITVALLRGFKDIAKLLINHRQFKMNAPNSNDFTLLHTAAWKGNSTAVEALLTKGAQVNSEYSISNITPLHVASMNGHYEVVKVLVDYGVNVNKMTNCRTTALHLAAVEGHEKVVQLLLQSKAKCNIRDFKFRTPVELAAVHGHLLIVQNLLDTKEVNVNDKGTDDFTLLHIAAQEGNLELTKYITNKGADIHCQNNAGSKPIHIAARDGHTHIVEYFLGKNIHVDVDGVAGGSLLHYAAQGGQVEVAQFLLHNKANPNKQNNLGSTPIHFAAKFGFMDVVKVLLENGAFYNAVDQQHYTPLHVAKSDDIKDLLKSCEDLFQAVKKNDPSQVKLHIKNGLVNIRNKSNETPLLYAAWKGYDGVVDVLLKREADPNVRGKNNCTALHYACKFSHVKIVKDLLSSGAMYNIKTCAQKTPLSFAENQEIVDLLKFIGEAFNKVQNCNLQVINDLQTLTNSVAMKVILNVCNDRNKTLLECAVVNDFPKLNKLKEVLQGDLSTHSLVAKALCFGEKFAKAEEVLEKGLKKKKEMCGRDNSSLFDAQLQLGIVFYKQQKYAKALNIFQEIYEKQVKLFEVHNADAQRTRSYIALVLHRQGKNEEALIIFQEVLQIQNEILGTNDDDVLDTQSHMALVLMEMRKNEEALSINYDVLEKRKKILGSSDPSTLCVENNIAMILNNLGKHKESLKLYEKVYEGRRKVLGLEHSDTLRTLFNMGEVFRIEKQYEEALDIWRQVLKIQKQVLMPNHLDILNTQYSIGLVCFQQGKYLFSWKILKEVKGKMISLLGTDHQQIVYINMMIRTVTTKFEHLGFESLRMWQEAEEQLQLSASSGNKKAVEILILCDFDVNSKDCNGRTALHCAAANGHTDTVVMLLENGADCLLVSSGKGNTALHLATANSFKDTVEVLLQHVIKIQSAKLNYFVNAKTALLGNTALHLACDKDTVKLLLRYGAIFDVKNIKGETPLDVAKSSSIANLLHSARKSVFDTVVGNSG